MRLPDFKTARILVAGDLMLDRYWNGAVNRISPEAPVPVVRVQGAQDRPGGAGNVALNLASLGVRSTVVGYCGDDEAGASLISALRQSSVSCQIRQIPTISTTMKLRVISQHQQLIRIDFEEVLEVQGASDGLDEFRDALGNVDVVILSDYAKGALRNVRKMIALAAAGDIPTLIDPKGVDFDQYVGAYLITPNFAEFQAVVGPCRNDAELSSKGFALLERLSLSALVVTRGEEGMTLLCKDGRSIHLAAQAKEVFDVTGAGDTVISTIAAGIAIGISIEKAVAIANVAAGIVVGKLGTATVSPDELRVALRAPGTLHSGVVDEPELMASLAVAREIGEKIVVTNGCFDILHAGHVEYLKQSRDLGDRLIVLVNSDASVRRLKGSGRPINSVADRMAVLAALECVDWVMPFDEDTPRDAICRILPDVLVKGGDYADIEQIAGHDCVVASGGQVCLLGFKEGYSTTRIVDAMRRDA